MTSTSFQAWLCDQDDLFGIVVDRQIHTAFGSRAHQMLSRKHGGGRLKRMPAGRAFNPPAIGAIVARRPEVSQALVFAR